MPPSLASVDCWIFDLDNTLYPPSANIMAAVEARMSLFIAQRLGVDDDESHRIRHGYFVEHGTTLAGLMKSGAAQPHEFLDFVHDVPLDTLSPDPALAAAIARLPGRKLVFTNADASYAGRVLAALGLGNAFDGMHDIHASDYIPKPDPAPYATMCARLGVEPTRAFFAEDMARNLAPAKAMGMRTLWLDNGTAHGQAGATDDVIDFRAQSLNHWFQDNFEGVPS